MLQPFSLTHTPDIIFGAGSIINLPQKLASYNGKIALIHGHSFAQRDYGKKIMDNLTTAGIVFSSCVIDKEPSPKMIDSAVKELSTEKIKAVVSIGGGSVIDAGKAISAMLCSEGSISDYLEGIGTKTPSGTKIPFIAIPTTAGTGSEMTKNAVITQTEEGGFKKSLRHNNYVPDIAIVDPELTLSCPPKIIAASGLDAFSQLLESFLSTSGSIATNTFSMQGISLLLKSLLKAYQEPNDIEARTDVSYAAMLSGITLANAGLGAVHGFAQPLGFLFPIPHGVVCGSLIFAANKVTLERISEDYKYTTILDLYTSLGMFLFGPEIKVEHAADAFLKVIEDLTLQLDMPGLSDYGVKETDFDSILSYTDIKNHPYPLNSNDLKEILRRSL